MGVYLPKEVLHIGLKHLGFEKLPAEFMIVEVSFHFALSEFKDYGQFTIQLLGLLMIDHYPIVASCL